MRVIVLHAAVVPVTFTLKVQEAVRRKSCARQAHAEPEPATAVIVPPPQEPVRPLGVETTRPAGRVSVKATPVSEMVVFGLLMVKLNEVLPPTGMVAAPNDLVIVGGVATAQIGRSGVAGAAIRGSHGARGVDELSRSRAGYRHAELALAVDGDGCAGQRDAGRRRSRQRSAANRGRSVGDRQAGRQRVSKCNSRSAQQHWRLDS